MTTDGRRAGVELDRSALMCTYAEPPVTFVRGEGTYLWDDEGRRYLDFLSGLAVTSLGHAHPVVAEALATQARTLLHVSNLFGNVIAPEVAATIDRLIGGGKERAGGQVFFCNSGAEANECAFKLAGDDGDGREWRAEFVGCGGSEAVELGQVLFARQY